MSLAWEGTPRVTSEPQPIDWSDLETTDDSIYILGRISLHAYLQTLRDSALSEWYASAQPIITKLIRDIQWEMMSRYAKLEEYDFSEEEINGRDEEDVPDYLRPLLEEKEDYD